MDKAKKDKRAAKTPESVAAADALLASAEAAQNPGMAGPWPWRWLSQHPLATWRRSNSNTKEDALLPFHHTCPPLWQTRRLRSAPGPATWTA